MGTHPIFESDFDCLTEAKNEVTMNRRLFGSLCFAQLVALCLYLSGFLLRRLPLPDRAPVADTPSLPPTYHKCIILLVDAWRHDFAIFNHSNANPLTFSTHRAKARPLPVCQCRRQRLARFPFSRWCRH